MRDIRPCWTILAHELAMIVRDWFIAAVREERRKKDPKQFERAIIVNLSGEALTSETHRVLGFGITDCIAKEKYKTAGQKQLLESMGCLEKDVDNAFTRSKYDLATMMRNTGREGGLTLVSDKYFDWGRKVMLAVAKALTTDDLRLKGESAFHAAKRSILNHPHFKSDLALITSKQQQTTYADSAFVYDIVIQKVCNARFGEVVKNYSEEESLRGKGKLTFRNDLLATTMRSGSKYGPTMEDAASTRPAAAAFVPLKPGVDGAVDGSFLTGQVFVLQGEFLEVDGQWRQAHSILTNMLTSFGAEVKRKYSKNTTYLLAGRETNGSKIKQAQERGVVVINLKRTHQLLAGELKWEALRSLSALTKDSFKADAYETLQPRPSSSAENPQPEPAPAGISQEPSAESVEQR